MLTSTAIEEAVRLSTSLSLWIPGVCCPF